MVSVFLCFCKDVSKCRLVGGDAFNALVWNTPVELVVGMNASEFVLRNDVEQNTIMKKLVKDFIADTKITGDVVHINMLWNLARQVRSLLLSFLIKS